MAVANQVRREWAQLQHCWWSVHHGSQPYPDYPPYWWRNVDDPALHEVITARASGTPGTDRCTSNYRWIYSYYFVLAMQRGVDRDRAEDAITRLMGDYYIHPEWHPVIWPDQLAWWLDEGIASDRRDAHLRDAADGPAETAAAPADDEFAAEINRMNSPRHGMATTADPGCGEHEPSFLDELAGRTVDRAEHPESYRSAVVIGEHIRRTRLRQGLTRREAAVRSGLDAFQIQLLEQGLLPDEDLSHDEIAALASAFAIDVADLTANLSLAGSKQKLTEPQGNELIRAWGRGVLRVIQGRWTLNPLPMQGLEPVSRRAPHAQHKVKTVLIEPTGDRLQVRAGTDYAGGSVLLLQLADDRASYQRIARVPLDDAGGADVLLPPPGLRLAVVVLPAGSSESNSAPHLDAND